MRRFLSTRNMANLFSGYAYIAVAAIGMTMVIITGNIDISVGSLMVSLSMLSGAISVYSHFPSWLSTDAIIALSWVLPVIAGGLVGIVIGFLVTYLRIPSIVVTLGFLSILKGVLIIVSGGTRITGMPHGYALAQQHPLENVSLPIFQDFFHALSMPVFFMVILTILAALWMRYTPTGRALYAVGGNAEAARLSGLSEHRIVMMAFILNGMFVGIAAVLNATQFSVIQVTLPPDRADHHHGGGRGRGKHSGRDRDRDRRDAGCDLAQYDYQGSGFPGYFALLDAALFRAF